MLGIRRILSLRRWFCLREVYLCDSPVLLAHLLCTSPHSPPPFCNFCSSLPSPTSQGTLPGCVHRLRSPPHSRFGNFCGSLPSPTSQGTLLGCIHRLHYSPHSPPPICNLCGSLPSPTSQGA